MANNDTSVGLYSDCVHIWIAFLVLTSPLFSHLRCPKLFGDVMSSYTAVDGSMVNSMLTIILARPAVVLLYTWKLWLYNNNDITLWSFGGLLSKLPIRQNKFPVRISGHTVSHHTAQVGTLASCVSWSLHLAHYIHYITALAGGLPKGGILVYIHTLTYGRKLATHAGTTDWEDVSL